MFATLSIGLRGHRNGRAVNWSRGSSEHSRRWLLRSPRLGLYSVVAYTVVQRTNEFGIRIALGAKKGHVLGIRLSVNGGQRWYWNLAGVVLTIALNKVMANWAAESSRDPLLLLGATFVLSLVATLACIIPAWRAAGINPMTAIRYE